MTKPCAVPNCRTGYRSEKTKHSVFRVPRDKERLKQWKEAIPGIAQLKESQTVCDKHFEDKYIIREWIHRDANNKIIATAPYKHPKLSELAVPTIFEDDIVKKAFGDLSGEYVDVPAEPQAPNKENYPSTEVNPIVFEYVETQSLEQSDRNLAYEFIDPDAEPIDKDITIENESRIESSTSGDEILPHSEERLEGDFAVTNNIDNVNCNESTKDSGGDSPVPIIVDTKISRTKQRSVPAAAQVVQKKPFAVCSIVASNQYIETANEMLSCNVGNSLRLPSCWSVAELPRDSCDLFVFSYLATKLEDGIYAPIAQRSVTVDDDNKIEYFIYGRRVNAEETQLKRVLEGIDELPKILLNFQWRSLCRGLGEFNGFEVPIDLGFLDYVQQRRDTNCSMLSGKKRCENCSKLRKRILQQAARSNSGFCDYDNQQQQLRPSHRIAKTPAEKEQLREIRNNNRREKRKAIRAKLRVQILRDSLREKEETLARVRAETLHDKCMQLNVSDAQKEAIRKVIAAASRESI